MKILITIWGPEYGCLFREIEIARALIEQGHKVQFIINKNHIEIIKNYFGKRSILYYFDWKIVQYKDNNDLDFFKTITFYMKFLFFRGVSEFSQFKRAVRKFKPDIIINDFIPHIVIFSKILNLKCIGVFNYALIKHNLTPTLVGKITHSFTRHIFNLLYRLNSLNIIETIGEKMKNTKNIIFVKPIAIDKKRDRKFLKEKLGIIKSNCLLVFYSLGGGFYHYKNLLLMDKLIEGNEEIRIFVLPRNKQEILFFKKNFKNILFVKDLAFDPSEYIYHADLIITKCGFRTIVDAIKNKCLILPIHTPNHPEIFETEVLLKKHNLVYDTISTMDYEIIEKIKKVVSCKTTLLSNYNKIDFCDLKIVLDFMNKLDKKERR